MLVWVHAFKSCASQNTLKELSSTHPHKSRKQQGWGLGQPTDETFQQIPGKQKTDGSILRDHSKGSYSWECPMTGLGGEMGYHNLPTRISEGLQAQREGLIWSLETDNFAENINREEVCQLNVPLSTSLTADIRKPCGELRFLLGCWHPQ